MYIVVEHSREKLKNLALFSSPFLRKHADYDVSKDSDNKRCLESSFLSEKVEGFDNKYTSTKTKLRASFSVHRVYIQHTFSVHRVSNFVVCGTFTTKFSRILIVLNMKRKKWLNAFFSARNNLLNSLVRSVHGEISDL